MYSPKVHHDGPDILVVESGGTLKIESGATVEGVITAALVVDSLVSTSATNALSAKQGKVLKDAADAKVATVQDANATTAATDLATAEALANALKADLNALIAKLKAAGIMASA